MKEFFKQIRMEVYLSALLTIILGAVLLIWPLQVTGLICQALGVLLMVMGAVYLFAYFLEGRGIFSVAGGLIFLLLGVWIFLRPGYVARLIPLFIGVVMLVHSIRDFQMAAESKRNGSERWWVLFMLALVNFAFGVMCIFKSFDVLRVAVQLIGVALLYDGITDILIVHHTVKTVKKAAQKLEPVDVEYRNVND